MWNVNLFLLLTSPETRVNLGSRTSWLLFLFSLLLSLSLSFSYILFIFLSFHSSLSLLPHIFMMMMNPFWPVVGKLIRRNASRFMSLLFHSLTLSLIFSFSLFLFHFSSDSHYFPQLWAGMRKEKTHYWLNHPSQNILSFSKRFPFLS